MKLFIITALVAVAAASQTYDRREVSSYNDNSYDRKDDYSYAKAGDYSYDRKDYGYGYDQKDDYSNARKDDYSYERKNDYSYDTKDYGYGYDQKDDYSSEKKSYGTGYYGKYSGKCENDGLYYRDETSFVFCSNGHSSVQNCAPGTKNSAYQKYSSGAKYNYRDFCDVNLVISGYGYDEKDDYSYDQKDDYSYNKKDDYYYDRKDDYSYERKDDYTYNKKDDYSYDRKDDYSYNKKDDYSYNRKDDYSYERKDDYSYDTKDYGYGYDQKDDYSNEKQSYGTGYYGKYSGKCGNDGLYYRDETSFVFCSNGHSSVQNCAPGTKNSAYQKYSSGAKYSYRDFCDVNLVAAGYGVSKGYGKH